MPDENSDRELAEETMLMDAEAANRWALAPHFLESSRRWTWCRAAWPAVLLDPVEGTEALARDAEVDLQALANGFWPWVDGLERGRHFEVLDPVDFSHFAAGSLLYHLLQVHPGPLPVTDRAGEIRALTRVVLTLLAAWRVALGSPAIRMQLGNNSRATWASFVENMREDPSLAVPFLDSFTGQEPVWLFPLMLGERPAVRRALQERRASGSNQSA